ncbi:MAG: hypothetical protein JRJ87_04825 [Deltaproteobacteria bacterium]|nr:hypothetical protein [Deltaproteobacteria bacterium]
MGTSRKKALQILHDRDLAALLSWTSNTRSSLRTLFSLSYSEDDLIGWRAIEGIGIAAMQIAKSDLEMVKDFLRRLFWLMNDESGGLSRRAPEVIGEILFGLPSLISEFGILLFHFTREEPFERGSFSALARISSRAPELIEENREIFLSALDDPDPAIRVYALTALSTVETGLVAQQVEKLLNDHALVATYDFPTGKIIETTVAGFAKQLATIK